MVEKSEQDTSVKEVRKSAYSTLKIEAMFLGNVG
jgi:hypothetical protein